MVLKASLRTRTRINITAALFGTTSDVEWYGYYVIIKNTAKHAVIKGTDDVDEFRRIADFQEIFPMNWIKGFGEIYEDHRDLGEIYEDHVEISVLFPAILLKLSGSEDHVGRTSTGTEVTLRSHGGHTDSQSKRSGGEQE